MPTVSQLQNELDGLRSILADRDRADAKARADAAAAAIASADAKAQAERVKAMAEEQEAIRRGSWVSVILGRSDPAAPLDAVAIEKAIPADPNVWPEGVSPQSFALTGGTRISTEAKVEFESTHIGRLFAALAPKKI